MHTNHVDALWDFLTSGRTQTLVEQLRAASHDEALAVLDISEVGPSSTREEQSEQSTTDPQHGRKSAKSGAHEGSSISPTAGLGTAEAGKATPSGARYFSVKIDALGRTYYRHIEATDDMQAGRNVLARNPSAMSALVVREIDRAEFERLTGGRQ